MKTPLTEKQKYEIAHRIVQAVYSSLTETEQKEKAREVFNRIINNPEKFEQFLNELNEEYSKETK